MPRNRHPGRSAAPRVRDPAARAPGSIRPPTRARRSRMARLMLFGGVRFILSLPASLSFTRALGSARGPAQAVWRRGRRRTGTGEAPSTGKFSWCALHAMTRINGLGSADSDRMIREWRFAFCAVHFVLCSRSPWERDKGGKKGGREGGRREGGKGEREKEREGGRGRGRGREVSFLRTTWEAARTQASHPSAPSTRATSCWTCGRPGEAAAAR